MKKRTKKIIAGIILFILVGVAGIGSYLYSQWYSPFFNINEPVSVYIDERKDFNNLLLQLETVAKVKDVDLFRQLATVLKYPENMKTGHFIITPKMSCKTLVQNLKNGNQTPLRISFNNVRLKEDLADRLGSQLMFGTEALLSKLNNPETCVKFGFTTETILCMFVPNTYELYWNLPVDRFLERMKKEYDRFWTSERMEKAEAISLDPIQISILASIVEEETAVVDEYPIVAGLYINRLKQGMLLQADPTVKYAVGDFSLRRILYAHLETESPYNTYIHKGLPPGPIRIPSIAGLDAALNYARTNYLYMCAREDFSGRHNFATTMREHNKNAAEYRAALNRNNIR